MKYIDKRINNQLSFGQYSKIVNEYLNRMGRLECSGGTMTYQDFSSVCYARNKEEKQLNIVINYENQTIEIS